MFVEIFRPQTHLGTTRSHTTYYQYTQFFKFKLSQRPQFKKIAIKEKLPIYIIFKLKLS